MKVPSKAEIFSLRQGADFKKTALAVFRFQAETNLIYRQYIDLMRVKPQSVKEIFEIPFMPVSFFRDHMVVSGKWEPETVFLSSATTGMTPSRHAVKELSLYNESLEKAFTLFYGRPSDYAIIGLLPSYLEREGSSLIHMVRRLIELSDNDFGGFFLSDYQAMLYAIERSRHAGLKIILFGVTFALLDLAETKPCDLHDVIIIETGGMKGRRKEIIREELHSILKSSFNTAAIHSEYGMTEMLSQAYSKAGGLFTTPPWMKVLIRDSHDIMTHTDEAGSSGAISVIDLANLWSCSFVATSDLGRMHENGAFEVLGRFDNADIRGCSLLVS